MIKQIFSDGKLNKVINGFIQFSLIRTAIIASILFVIGVIINKFLDCFFVTLFLLSAEVIVLFQIIIVWYIYKLTVISFEENKLKLLVLSIIIFGLIIIKIVNTEGILFILLSPIIGAFGWFFAFIGSYISISIYLWFDKKNFLKLHLWFSGLKAPKKSVNLISVIIGILFVICLIYVICDQLCLTQKISDILQRL
jgi:hypothetical protein